MKRPSSISALNAAFRVHPVVTLVGPRQCGKTTLALEYAKTRKGPVLHLDLELASDLARLENPMLALRDARGLVIIDEVQRRADLFPALRVIVDRAPRDLRLLLLGSASGDLLRQSSESLIGRATLLELTPFSLHETKESKKLWLRGGFPRAYLARRDVDAFAWLDAYASMFLERDIPSFGVRVPAAALRRFWMMLAHVHGQTLNLSELGRAFGASHHTISHYVDLLTSTFMVRQLQPWHENLSKRQVKAPKLYFRDTGLLHALLGIHERAALESSPRVGASWEGFALETIVRRLGLSASECYFWGTHADAELDLLTFVRSRRIGFEIKRADAPRITRSMRIALDDLKLDHLYVVTPGHDTFPMDERITALGLDAVPSRSEW